ncbi:MAG: M50 family metallopeptidase [Candidatus Hodarchaeota archaeon]
MREKGIEKLKSELTFDPNLIPRVINISRISKFDTAYSADCYVIVSTFGRSFRITEAMYNILRQINGKRTLEELTRVIREQESLDAKPEDLWELFINHLRPRGLITFQKEKTRERTEKELTSNMPVRFIILPQKLQLRLSRFLARCVSLPILLGLLGAFIGLTMITRRPEQNTATPLDLLAVFILFVIGAVIHELGHSAAAVRGGIQPGKIGMRFFVLFPVFSIDLNDGWTLNRKKRIELDLGGIGLQSAYGILLLIASSFIQSALVFDAAAITFTMTIFNLMPFPSFDGYWFLSDALGIPNLRKEGVAQVKAMLTRKKGKEEPWGKIATPIKIVILGYGVFTIFSSLLVVTFMYSFAVMFISLVIALPASIEQIGIAYLEGRMLDALSQIIGLGFMLIFLVGFSIMFIGIVLSFRPGLARIYNRVRKNTAKTMT